MNTYEILAPALGLFVGNFLFYAIFKKDWKAGVFIGSVAAILYIPLIYIAKILHIIS